MKNITIIDQQADFIVVDKPQNIGFHDESEIIGFFNQVKLALGLDELYPVHRLDKMTSGLLIIAKTKKAAVKFQALFEGKLVEKYYLAISDKKPNKKQGIVKGDMSKSRRGMWKLLRSNDNPAISQFFSYSILNGKRLFLIKPQTGKTHQIRVALNSLGSPIIGDPTYYGSSIADRGYLHAYAIRFKLFEQQYCYLAPPSSGEEFKTAECINEIDKLRQPWQLCWPKL